MCQSPYSALRSYHNIPIILVVEMATTQVKNFFDVFGTTGCQLNCQERGQIYAENKTNNNVHSRAERKRARSNRRTDLTRSLGSYQEWFTADQIGASIASGCGSCRVLSHIFQNSFSGNQQVLSDKYQYSLARNFELRRRPLAQLDPAEIIQLFQPLGL